MNLYGYQYQMLVNLEEQMDMIGEVNNQYYLVVQNHLQMDIQQKKKNMMKCLIV